MKRKLFKKINNPVVFCSFIAATVFTVLLFAKPTVGIADNSDFARIMSVAGLDFFHESRFTNVVPHYRIVGRLLSLSGFSNYATTHIIPVKIAIAVNKLFFSGDIFDIRFLGLLYSIIHIAGLTLLISATVKSGKVPESKSLQFLAAALLVFIFCDMGYLAYFNSFFGEAPTFVFLLSMTGIALYMAARKKVTPVWILLFFVAALMFAGSKQANLPTVLFVPVISLAFMFANPKRSVIASVTVCTVALIAVSVLLFASVSEPLRQVNQYHSVFFGILKDSPSPEEDLEKLGLDPELKVLANTTYYDRSIPVKNDSEYMESKFFSRISYTDVLKYYIMNPSRFYDKLKISAENSVSIRPPYLGNFIYEETGSRLAFAERATLWSRIKKVYMPRSVSFIIFFFTAYLLYIIRLFVRAVKNKADRFALVEPAVLCFLWCTAAVAFVTPVLAAGEADIAKHLFLYNVCFDLLFAFAAIGIVSAAVSALKILNFRNFNRSYKRSYKYGHKEAMPFQFVQFFRYVFKYVIAFAVILSVAIVLFAQKGPLSGNSEVEISRVGFLSRTVAGEEIKIGSYVKFGRYRGKELLWQVAGTENGNLLLVADRIICFRPFDIPDAGEKTPERRKFGSNLWESSLLRSWLNSEGVVNGEPGFLSYFSEKEKNMLVKSRNKFLLSLYDADIREGGSSPYFWTNSVPLLLQNYDDAYFSISEDWVFIPDVREIKELVYDNGLSIRKRALFTDNLDIKYEAGKNHYMPYWLRTPYVNSESMVRYVGEDGYVYHCDALNDTVGVLPLVKVSFIAIKGAGSRADPYILF